MKVTLTDKGLQALAQNQAVQLLDFIVSDSRSLSAMEQYVAGQSVGSNTFYQYGIEENHTYIKGDTYTPSDGSKPYKVENTFLELIGTLNCLDVPSSFTMRSMGIKAKIGNNSPFVYAFGSISSSDKPYPINSGELISYITPVKIIYDNAPDVTTEESGVPWKNFIQHADVSVNSEDGIHGLKIDPDTLEMTVGNTSIILSGGDERIAELEREVQGVLKYSSSEVREYNSEWVDRMSGSGTIGDPYLIYTPKDLYELRKLCDTYFEDQTTKPVTARMNAHQYLYAKLMNNLDMYPAIGIKGYSNAEGYGVYPEYDNPDAPLYNDGNGWRNYWLSYVVFDGNYKYIKNLFVNATAYYLSSDRTYCSPGLFGQINYYSTITGIKLIDSVITAGVSGYDISVGSIVSQVNDESQVINCSSSADIAAVNSMRSNNRYGGIAGYTLGRGGARYCAFHGTINNFTISYQTGSVGGVVGRGYRDYSQSQVTVGCYTGCTINFGNCRGGISGEIYTNSISSYLIGNYFTGYVQDYNTLISQSRNCNSLFGGNSWGPQSQQRLAKNYSLENSCSTLVQGTICSSEYMKSRDFVTDLNATLINNGYEARFVYREGSYPRLDFEEDDIPYQAPIATIDTSNNYVLDSGYTVDTLSKMATSQDVATLTTSLTNMVATKSAVKIVEITIRTTDWGNPGWDSKSWYYYDDDIPNNQSATNILPVMTSYDLFDYGIYIGGTGMRNVSGDVYRGYIEFKCNTKPLVDITFKTIIILGPSFYN